MTQKSLSITLSDLKLSETVFVLDLDDTLYQEANYQASGFKEVVRKIQEIYGKNLENDLIRLIREGSTDVLEELCKVAGLPNSVKYAFLWIYRLHHPNISLEPDVKKFVNLLKQRAAGVAILTDGRSFSQRAKLKALGLSQFPAYISEEYGDQKPSSTRFEAIASDISAKQYIYIADNPEKDFLAPNKLGWQTIGVIDNGKNIHSQIVKGLPNEYLPSFWIHSLSELLPQALC